MLSTLPIFCSRSNNINLAPYLFSYPPGTRLPSLNNARTTKLSSFAVTNMVNEKQIVLLDGGKSIDVDGDKLSFAWTQVSPNKPKKGTDV